MLHLPPPLLNPGKYELIDAVGIIYVFEGFPNGVTVTDNECTTHGAQRCLSCEEFYHPDVGSFPSTGCDRNICTCNQGIGTINCEVHDQEECEECNSGYRLDQVNKICVANVCTCADGTPIKTPNCPLDGQNFCGTCIDFYHPEDDGPNLRNCLPNECRCDNGQGVPSEECINHDEIQCIPTSCLPGYHYDDVTRSCETNICTCENGKAPTKADCTTHGLEICIKNACFEGYHFISNRGKASCRANVCYCNAGVADDGPNRWETNYVDNNNVKHICKENDAVQCINCDNFHHLNIASKECVQNTCRCTNGTPSRKGTCPYEYHYDPKIFKYSDPTNHCESCDNSWFLEESNNCCDGITKHCISCMTDFHIDYDSICVEKFEEISSMRNLVRFVHYENIQDCPEVETEISGQKWGTCLYKENSQNFVDSSLLFQGDVRYKFNLLASDPKIGPGEYSSFIFSQYITKSAERLTNLEISTDINSVLGNYALYGLDNLKVFYASTFGNTRIPLEFFKNLANLYVVRFGKVQESPTLPTRINQSVHSKVSFIHDQAFETNINLEILEMPGNEIKSITLNMFINNVNLKRLDFRYNNIEIIDSRAFANNNKLETILLEDNAILTLSAEVFNNLSNLEILSLNSNGNSEIVADTLIEKQNCENGFRVNGGRVTTCSLVASNL